MKVSYSLIDKIISMDWDECINYEIEDKETFGFISDFIKNYYDKVQRGLFDYPHNSQLRKECFESLLQLVSDERCILYDNILNCLNDIDNKNFTENILINSIFKLQSCKNIEW